MASVSTTHSRCAQTWECNSCPELSEINQIGSEKMIVLCLNFLTFLCFLVNWIGSASRKRQCAVALSSSVAVLLSSRSLAAYVLFSTHLGPCRGWRTSADVLARLPRAQAWQAGPCCILHPRGRKAHTRARRPIKSQVSFFYN